MKTSAFTDEKFLIVLFPVEANTSCKRAVLASLAEYHREFLDIYADGIAMTVPQSGFTAAPPEDYGVYGERLNRELGVWGAETDWSRIDYAATPSEGGNRTTVNITDKSGTIRTYTYVASGPLVRPIGTETKVNTARTMAQ